MWCEITTLKIPFVGKLIFNVHFYLFFLKINAFFKRLEIRGVKIEEQK